MNKHLMNLLTNHTVGRIAYVKRLHPEWPLHDIIVMWHDAKRSPNLGTVEFLHPEGIRAVDEFFLAVASRSYDEATEWWCVNGCCTVIWGNGKRGNMGGFGPAGCSCDMLDDPRDIARGPMPKETK